MNVNKRQQLAILTFRLANQYYALPIMNVLEVAAMMSLTKIPNAPEELLGIANRHGEVLPMLDLRIAFSLEAAPIDLSTLFIVAQSDDLRVGLIVDEIFQVKYIDQRAIQEAHGAGDYISHIISDNQTLYQQMTLQALLEDYPVYIQL